MKKWAGILLFIAPCFFGASLVSAQNSAIDAAKAAFENLAKSGALLDLCPQYHGMKAVGCTTADKAGDGLECPTTHLATGGSPENCKMSIMEQLKASLGIELKAKLEASSLQTAEMYVDITPQESASHRHAALSKTAGTCGPDYIKRKDFDKFRFALYNGKEVNMSITVPNFPEFDAKVRAAEGMTKSFDSLICGREQHSGTCGPAGATPPSPSPPGETPPPPHGTEVPH